MSGLGYHSNTEYIAGSLLLFFAFIGLICTCLTLWLIYDMKRRNGYLLLISTLTICQAVYDLAFFLLPLYKIKSCLYIVTFTWMLSGMSATLWTNVISLVLYNVVRHLQSFDIYGYYFAFSASIYVPSLLIAILVIVFYDHSPEFLVFNQIYYWVRIGSIVFNLVIYGLISYKLNAMDATQQDPVRILASRIKYYPIVQIISRAGAAWYELAYGFKTDSYSTDMSPTQTAVFFFYALCVPVAGIGYFLVFLIVQPTAYLHLKSAARRICRIFSCDDDERQDSRYDSFSALPLGPDGMQNRMSLPLMSNEEVTYDHLDEEELSAQIDHNYQVRGSDVSAASMIGVASYADMFRTGGGGGMHKNSMSSLQHSPMSLGR